MSEAHKKFFDDLWDMLLADQGGEFMCNDIYEIAIKHGLAEWRTVNPAENEWDADMLCFKTDTPAAAHDRGDEEG